MSFHLKDHPKFNNMLEKWDIEIRRNSVKTLQVNLGKRCNQKCAHCHVEASPGSTESMDESTVNRLMKLLANAPQVEIVDFTGGAPELNPHFCKLIAAVRAMNKEVIVRTNLTVLFDLKQDIPQFLADHRVQIFASLPCYTQENVNKQRGAGAFEKSIEILKNLNSLGYGKTDTGLILNLVYNPLGAYLPPSQLQLEQDYKTRLKEDFGVEFNQLIVITNMPIGRFAQFLTKEESLRDYMHLLIDYFNPNIVPKVMCTQMISVSWDGNIYDCDFNQMLKIPISRKEATNLWNIDRIDELSCTKIALDDHCYGCTAGAGSSCGGVLEASGC